jgi:glucose-6-phosphate isomerase
MEHDLSKFTPDIRKLNDMKDIVFDKEWAKSAENFELYYMYRGVEKNDDLRYDITIIPARMMGAEFVKTKGHYHLNNWQEIYTVLEGTAIYLMQKRNAKGDIEDSYFVKTEKGESVIIPKGYGHVTINPLDKELKMANWVSENCKVDYLPYEKLQGACYYYIEGPASAEGFGEGTWVKNENYKNLPELREEKPLKSLPEDLDFLKIG